jgi:hypothetical protein
MKLATFTGRQVDKWLAGWLAGWLDGWLAGWLDGWMCPIHYLPNLSSSPLYITRLRIINFLKIL